MKKVYILVYRKKSDCKHLRHFCYDSVYIDRDEADRWAGVYGSAYPDRSYIVLTQELKVREVQKCY